MSPYIILVCLLGYFGVLLIISFLTSRKADNNSFFIGNRKSPWYLVAMGMIGASLSGVTFISVPGWVITSKFYYMQVVFGYLLGYVAIIYVLLPLYYKINAISIYTYLKQRFGVVSYKTGACLFLVSRIIGSAFRLFLMANVLQIAIFNALHIPFAVTICITLLFIYAYTFKGGVKTIIWTDTIQAILLVTAVVGSILIISHQLDLNIKGIIHSIASHEQSKIFNFSSWTDKHFFVKQFISGAFITIVMTGLDQDMMQKNLSCRSLKDAQKNMFTYSLLYVPINLLFLSLGVLLIIYCQSKGIALPKSTDDLYPMIATGGYFPFYMTLIFVIGLVAAAYSTADSALTALTTSVTIDIFEADNMEEKKLRKFRMLVHIMISIVIGIIIFLFKLLNNDAVISSLFTAAGYTYGPLLGLFVIGLFTKINLRDKWVPVVAILSPVICFVIDYFSETILFGYQFGFEILLLNGAITIIGLLIISRKNKQPELPD